MFEMQAFVHAGTIQYLHGGPTSISSKLVLVYTQLCTKTNLQPYSISHLVLLQTLKQQ